MAIIPQLSLFSWQDLQELGDLERLVIVLDTVPDEALMGQLLRAFTGDADLSLVELSFGTNMTLFPDTVDWTINAQLHEGLHGVHAGIGDGVTGVHIDFVCPGVVLA
jgi:hypothetical protein